MLMQIHEQITQKEDKTKTKESNNKEGRKKRMIGSKAKEQDHFLRMTMLKFLG